MKTGILGGGHVGQKLAALAQAAGDDVIVGHRDLSKAVPGSPWRNVGLAEAAREAEVAFIAIPYRVCAEVLAPLADSLVGKVVIDTTNPHKEDWSPMLLGEENSAGEEIARLLPRSHIVKALNTVFAHIMVPERLVRDGRAGTGFLCGDDAEARKVVAGFLRRIGFEPIDCGPIQNARYFEAMAHLNVYLAVNLGGGADAAFFYEQARS